MEEMYLQLNSVLLLKVLLQPETVLLSMAYVICTKGLADIYGLYCHLNSSAILLPGAEFVWVASTAM